MAIVIDAPRAKNCGDCIGYNNCKGWNEAPYTCPIKGEIADKHGDLIEKDKIIDILRFSCSMYELNNDRALKCDGCEMRNDCGIRFLYEIITDIPVVLGASK